MLLKSKAIKLMETVVTHNYILLNVNFLVIFISSFLTNVKSMIYWVYWLTKSYHIEFWRLDYDCYINTYIGKHEKIACNAITWPWTQNTTSTFVNWCLLTVHMCVLALGYQKQPVTTTMTFLKQDWHWDVNLIMFEYIWNQRTGYVFKVNL